jgi:hypothetical protein
MSNIGYASINVPTTKQRRRAKIIGSTRATAQIKMKKTFKQHLRDWLFDHDSNADEYNQNFVRVDEENRLESNGMRFQLYRATGGYVIEVRSYDEHKDRTNTSMYVITDDRDLGEELGKIVTMECLKR